MLLGILSLSAENMVHIKNYLPAQLYTGNEYSDNKCACVLQCLSFYHARVSTVAKEG